MDCAIFCFYFGPECPPFHSNKGLRRVNVGFCQEKVQNRTKTPEIFGPHTWIVFGPFAGFKI
jgi:hypothetical protein